MVNDLWWREQDADYIRRRGERYPGATGVEPEWTLEAAADPRRIVREPDPPSSRGVGFPPATQRGWPGPPPPPAEHTTQWPTHFAWPYTQGHVKIAACAELVTLNGELWNTAAPEYPAQNTLSLEFGLLAVVTFRYRCRT